MKQQPLFDWAPVAVRLKNGTSGHRRLLLHERTCRACGNQYQPTRRDQTYCTSRCRKEHSDYGRVHKAANRAKYTEYARAHRERNRDRYFDRRLQREYGITLADYYRILTTQGGGCGICGVAESRNKDGSGRLHVDHDHATGNVRGLLCDTCNRGIGQLGDNVDRVKAAVRYLLRTATNTERFTPPHESAAALCAMLTKGVQ